MYYLYAKTRKVRAVGIQPLARPSQQDGYVLKLAETDDFANHSTRVIFMQGFDINTKVNRAMMGGADYFPSENINLAAKTIQRSDLITRSAIDDFLKDQQNGNLYLSRVVKEDELTKIINDKGYHVVDVEVIPPEYRQPSTGQFMIRKLIERPSYRG